jgi:hypothetical protein
VESGEYRQTVNFKALQVIYCLAVDLICLRQGISCIDSCRVRYIFCLSAMRKALEIAYDGIVNIIVDLKALLTGLDDEVRSIYRSPVIEIFAVGPE